ncbi:MAG: MFS transporter [Oscillospiraceae bacterium]|nr:MFS transporter [Oscillospiraceae bacterium]MDD6527284.1 MFS transporter [Oscillospiraceae bacterium]
MGEKIKKAIGVKGDFKTAILPMINYSYTNMYLGGSGYIISMYLTIFLTDVVNLSLKQAGLVVMFATIWDAVTDPAMGIITDRTRSKTGKHRRYLLWGIPLMFVSYSLLWNSFGLNGKTNPTAAMVYFVLIYMVYKTAYTIIAVPHTAMLPELAPEYDLRTQYNSMGYLFNSAGMVPSFGIIVLILGLFGSGDNLTSESKMPFLITGLVLSLFYSVAVFLTYKTTREPSSLDNKLEPFDIKYFFNEYYLVFKNRSFRQYFFMSLAYQFSTGFYASSKVYYIKYLANQYSKYALFNAIAGVAEASAFPFNYALTMKFGKKRCGDIVTPLMVAGLAIGLFMQGGSKASPIWVVLMLLSMILYPFGMSGLGFVSTNVFPDLTDVDELITGRRREGVISTFSTLIKKSISGVMAFFVSFILQSFGLVTGDTVSEYEKVNGTLYTQSSSAVLGVRICVAVIPIIAAVIALILLKKFKMTKEDHTMIRAAVATKHKYGSVTLSDEERERIELVSGQKIENTWLGKDNNSGEIHTLDKNEDGDYIILIEKELETKREIEEQKENAK